MKFVWFYDSLSPKVSDVINKPFLGLSTRGRMLSKYVFVLNPHPRTKREDSRQRLQMRIRVCIMYSFIPWVSASSNGKQRYRLPGIQYRCALHTLNASEKNKISASLRSVAHKSTLSNRLTILSSSQPIKPWSVAHRPIVGPNLN